MMTTDDILVLAHQNHALQRLGELAQLVDIVRDHAPRVVLEIGTFRGGTLAAWCQCAADDATLITVDKPGGEFGGGWSPQDVHHLMYLGREQQGITLIDGDSHDPAIKQKVLDALNGRDVDFLFIDGDHTLEGVKQDFEDYAPLVRAGGIIAFHDVVPYPEVPRCQVDRFWREHILPAYPEAVEIRTEGDYLGCGIGVVWAK